MSARDQLAAFPSRLWIGAAARIVRLLLGLVLIAMVGLNVANAVARYAFGAVLIGADEILVFGMVWLIMMGLILATGERAHIALDFLPRRAGSQARLILAIVHFAVIVSVCGYLTVQSFQFVQRVAALGQTSMGLAIPMYLPHAALLVGFGVTTIVGLAILAGDVRALLCGRHEEAP